MNGEIINTHIKATENTTLAKLSFLDQFKLLISRFSNSEVAELDAAEKLSRQTLTMRASLINLFTNATRGLEDGTHNSVTLSVSSKFLPYIDAVIDPIHGMGQYYDFDVRTKDLPLNVEYMFVVKISRRVSK